jgi:hypothetical protein
MCLGTGFERQISREAVPIDYGREMRTTISDVPRKENSGIRWKFRWHLSCSHTRGGQVRIMSKRKSGKTGPRSVGAPAWPIVVISLIALSLASAAVAATPAPQTSGPLRQDGLRERVERAALALYIHGMTAEIAEREVGVAGLPVLQELLADPAFPRRDNVVAFLAFLGGSDATRSLALILESPPGVVGLPEERRALLLAPQALGQIASRGDLTALDLLLEITDPATGNNLLRRTASRDSDPDRFHADLLRMALRGLAYSGTATADRRLLRMARGDLRLPALPDAHADARVALDLRNELRTSAATGDLMATADEAQSSLTSGSLDTWALVHDTGLTCANHVDTGNPMDETRLDNVLDLASLRAGRGDDAADVACCITLSRSGTAASFGSPGDGLDIIDDDLELYSVLDDPSARFKVVSAINYCGGPGTNIIGCAWQPGSGAAVVRMSGEENEAVLWIHEYGHNTGLSHNSAGSRYLMYGINYGSNDLLDQQECDTFHEPHAWADIDPTDTGVCADGDGDLVHDGIDNCPDTPNPVQQDSDGDRVGDACPSSPCGNGSIDSGEECDGADLAGETCETLGCREGTPACNDQCMLDWSGCACMDADADMWADDVAPMGTCAKDCDDANGMAWDTPGAAGDIIFSLNHDTLEWDAPTDPGSATSALAYDVLRSTDPSDFGSGTICVESDDGSDTLADDPEVPASGSVFFYLIRAENTCPDGSGPLGPNRTGRACGP